MVSRRELINVCTALLCVGSATAAAAEGSSRPNLRARRNAVEVTTFAPVAAPTPSQESLHPTPDVKSHTLHPTDTHFTEPPTAAVILADVASGIEAYGSAYNEAVQESCSGGIFQLDLHTDEAACETSWTLTRIESDGSSVTVEEDTLEMYPNTGYFAEVYRCLEPGQYEFTITDSHGDGLVDDGYYLIALNEGIIGGSSGFGYAETTPFVVSAAAASPETRLSGDILLSEDFTSPSSLDTFTISSDNDVKYYNTMFGREGVVRIQNANGYITTNVPIPSTSYSSYTVTFSYFANSMENNEGFCLDFSTDGGNTWHSEECYTVGVDFENGLWYDDIGVEFDAEDIPGLQDSSSLGIRLISKVNSYNDDVLFDKIQVVGSL